MGRVKFQKQRRVSLYRGNFAEFTVGIMTGRRQDGASVSSGKREVGLHFDGIKGTFIERNISATFMIY
jgi:hypothetical protein